MALMGLDIGTTGCKAQVIDESGKRLGYAFREYGVETGPDGKAEQDAEAVWKAAAEVIGQANLDSKKTAPKDEVIAMSLSVQGDALIPVDSRGQALHPAILGMDYRSAPQAEFCTGTVGDRELFNITGMRSHPMNTLTKILLLRDMAPEVYRKSARMCTYADFILGKMGAPGITDLTMASRTMAWDLQQEAWSDEILNAVDVDPNLFSRPVVSGTEVGRLSPEAADMTGLPEGVLIATGGHDQPCAALGSGVTGPGRGVASTGTAEVFSCAFTDLEDYDTLYSGFYPAYAYVLPGRKFTFSLNHVGGILLKWFRDSFCSDEVRSAAKRGISAYRLLDESMPADPTKLFFLPHLNGSGTPWCDTRSRGAVLGLTMDTGRADIARAILESLTYELALNLETMETAGMRADSIVAAGGGASSPIWLQIKADILNRPVSVAENPEAGSLGAAILAGGAAKLWDPAEAAAELIRVTKTIDPDAEQVRLYSDRLNTYRMIYPALREVSRKIADE